MLPAIIVAAFVPLNGKVNTAAERQQIYDAANSVHGVKQVINNIQIK